MHKYLVTLRSGNPITGPIMVTTSPTYTCPASCALKGTQCYAEKGLLGGFIWRTLSRSAVGDILGNGLAVRSLSDLVLAIRALPAGGVWRHNQAGDLMPDASDRRLICRDTLEIICRANDGRRGFTFTHFDPTAGDNRRAIADANRAGFTINLSANDLHHADALADTACGPVAAILPRGHTRNTHTPAGRKVVVCPARTHGVTCSTCRLCTRQRDFIIGLPLL